MIDIQFLPQFTSRVDGYSMILIEADVVNGDTPDALTDEIRLTSDSMAAVMEIADINRRPAIAATRAAYKLLGKEPNRYRPSQEQMSRRVLKGLGLYTVNALVDLGNLLSLKTGDALGVFDKEKIVGDCLTLGVGHEGEPYEAIGRGLLNVACLPILRDAVGGIGTPTSDNVRTAVSPSTRHIVMTIHCYADEMAPDAIVTEARRLLETYAEATSFQYRVLKP